MSVVRTDVKNPMFAHGEEQEAAAAVVPDHHHLDIGAAAQATGRRRCVLSSVAAMSVVIVAVVATALVVLYATKGFGSSLTVPKTFSADFQVTAQSQGVASATGSLHKTLLPDGTWVVTGRVTVTKGNQTTEILAADDGAVYFTISWADGQVLYQRCLQAEDIPQLEALQDAMETASPIEEGVYNGVVPSGCAPSRSWVFQFGGLTLMLCQTADGSYQIGGPDFTGVLSNINGNAAAASPFKPAVNASASDGSLMQCPSVFKPANGQARQLLFQPGAWEEWSFTPVGALPWPYPPFPGMMPGGFGRRLVSPVSTYTPHMAVWYQTCVFVPGAGHVPAYGSPYVVSSLPEYWGSVKSYVNCATSVFLNVDMVNRPWDDVSLADAFCNAAGAGYGGRMQSTIVFAHGTGNLVVANALMLGRCYMDSITTAWMELQADYNSARFADFATGFCNYPSWNLQQSQLQYLMRLCNYNQPAIGWLSASPALFSPRTVSWSAAAQFIKSRVSGAMCGTYAPGLAGSSYFAVTSTFTSRSMLDVAWSTCWDPVYAGRFTTDGDAFFAASVNFLDVTCRNGNSYVSSSKQPCTWFKQRTM